MQNIICYFLLIIFFLLQGCSCNCNTIPTGDPNFSQINSKVYVFADGCGTSDGSVNSDGYSSANCDSSAGYVNRGYWVKAPNGVIDTGSTVSISVYDSIYYCSFGYDNTYSIPPYINVTPNGGIVTSFNSGSSQSPITVQGKQMVILDVNNTNTSAMAFGYNNSSDVNTLPECSSGDYLKFTADNAVNTTSKSLCRGENGFGLTVYVDNTEIITFDQAASNTYSTISSYYVGSQARTMNLFATGSSSLLNNFFDDTYKKLSYQYGPYSTGYGVGRYVLTIPSSISKGTLGFSIAQNLNQSGYGQYAVQVYTTPSSCYVNRAMVNSNPLRGALMVYIGNSNPNTTDQNLIQQTNSTINTTIQSYYPQLSNYVKQQQGYSINSNNVLSSMVQSSTSVAPSFYITANGGYSLAPSDYSGQMWFKVYDDYYHDNVGQYQVYINIKTPKSSIVSQLMVAVTEPITDILNNTTGIIYNSIIQNKDFRNIVKVTLVLYIILLGMQYALALTGIKANDLVKRIFKIATVIELFRKDNWDFFNRYLFNLFEQGSVYLVQAITGDTTTNRIGIFGFADTVFNQFFSSDTWQRVAALLPDPIGLIYVWILCVVMFAYAKICFKSLIAYLFVAIGTAVLISIAPLFIVMILFARTKKYFDNWIKYLADYALQPVFMFGTLYILNAIFITLWNNAMGFDICWGGVYEIIIDMSWLSLSTPLGSYTIPSFKLGCIQYYKVIGGINPLWMFAQFAILYFMVSAIEGLIAHVPTMTAFITGVRSAASAIDDLSNVEMKNIGRAYQTLRGKKEEKNDADQDSGSGVEIEKMSKKGSRVGSNTTIREP